MFATSLSPALVWFILGVVLVLAEIVVPSFFIIWFGLAAMGVALLLAAVSLHVAAQIALWLVLSFVFFGIFRYFYSPKRGVVPVGTSTGDVVGQVGVLVTDVTPLARGRVRFTKPVLGSEEWPCVAQEPIPEGTRVRVIGVEGQIVRVERSENN